MDAINQLIQARMKKNLTLEQVAHDTKIPIRYLQAIEKNQLDKLPKSSLTTMYLHTYAQFLNLPPDPILASFDESVMSDLHQSEQTKTTTISRQGQNPLRFTRNKWFWISTSLFVVIAMIGITWLVIDPFQTETKEASLQEQPLTETDELKEVSTFEFPSIQNRAKLELIEPIELNHKSDRYRLTNVQKIELVVIAKKPTTIEVNQNNHATKKKLNANEKVLFSDNKAISIQIDQPSLVSVSVNGITIEPSHPSKAASYQFELQNANE